MSEGFQKAQRDVFAKQAKEVDIIITTALIPGKPAPKLITADMVQSMKPGSVIVDMAAEQGGNCELTEPGKVVVQARRHHHRLHRPAQPARRGRRARCTRPTCCACPKSCARRRTARIDVNMDDEVIRGTTVVNQGAGHVAAAAAEAVRRAAGARRRLPRRDAASPGKKGHGHGGGEPMAAGTTGDAVRRRGACCSCSIGVFAPRGLPRPLHGVRAGVLHRLHGGVERDAVAAHAADERHQRDQQHHHHRRARADRAAA